MVALATPSGADSIDADAASRALFGPMVREFLDNALPDIRRESIDRALEAANTQLLKLPPLRISIELADFPPVEMSRQHYLFPVALKLLAAQDRFNMPLNIALVGETGTGKTRMCINAAEALKMPFILQPFNPLTTKSELLGYMDATGKYIPSPFYIAYKEGKLFIADEFDTANPGIVTVLNAAVGNRVITFPNGETVTAHKNFRAVFAMNTFGQGADDRYTGRSRLDMATLDRFVYLEVPIDQGFEASLVGIPDVASPTIDFAEGGMFESDREILQKVVSLRGAVQRESMRWSISPRVTINSCALHHAGFGKTWIEKMCMRRGISKPDWDRINGARR